MSNELAHRDLSNGLVVTQPPSKQASILAEMLLLCATMQGRDLMPGETRHWGQMFGNESPERLRWAFQEHLRTSKFFPKPADITELIDKYAASHPATRETCPQCADHNGYVFVDKYTVKLCNHEQLNG